MARARLAPGVAIDGFLLGELVHRGGMAMLWSVTRPDLDLPLLMKVPILAEGEDPAAIVGFEMEQMIMPRLSGPHVPRFIAAGDFAVQPYIVMERVPGPSLLPKLQSLPLPAAEVAALGAAVATALDDIHRQHVVHLDVKPSNIVMRDDGAAVLIDFGLAHHAQLPDLMQEEFRLPYGTAPYMAPEQVLGLRRDPRSDLFALGVLMYFFATGVRPFGDPQRLKGLKRRLWRDPVPPRKLRPDLPPWLQEIILHCLEVNPAWRHPTAAQLAVDLRAPDQVKLTQRAERRERDPLGAVLRRRFGSPPFPLSASGKPVIADTAEASPAGTAPIVAAAVDLSDAARPVAEAVRATVARLLERAPGARLACLNVQKLGLITLDTALDAEGRNKHVRNLVELRHWAEPLKLRDGAVSFHVLESTDAADAILDYARSNAVDHIVMGARANSTMRRLLGSVSGKVAAEAPCTVTVVRTRAAGDA